MSSNLSYFAQSAYAQFVVMFMMDFHVYVLFKK